MHGCGVSTIETISSGNDLPNPVITTSKVLDQGTCNKDSKKLEGMLVRLTGTSNNSGVNFLACGHESNPLMPPDYSYCKVSVTPSLSSSWDKFSQQVISSDDNTTVTELDDHKFAIFEQYNTVPGQVADSISGIVTRVSFEREARWEVAPRNENDTQGLDSLASLVKATTKQLTFKELVNKENALASSTDNALTYVHPRKRGKNVMIDGNPGEGPWLTGTCPPSGVQLWMDEDFGSAGSEFCENYDCQAQINPWAKTHSLCACYPLNEISNLGNQAAFYVNVTARVTWAEDNGKGSLFLEDADCSAADEKGLFVYRPSGEEVVPGQKINIIAKPYAYYGLEQLSDTFEINVLEEGEDCGATPLSDLSPFDLRNVTYMCDKDTDAKYSQKLVNLTGPLTVTGFTMDDPVFTDFHRESDPIDGSLTYGAHFVRKALKGTSEPEGYPFQNHGCAWTRVDNSGREYFPGCQLEVEDQMGNMALIDNKYGGTEPYYMGTVDGMNGMYVEIGDEFAAIAGMVEQHRGEHPALRGTTGGHYEINPRNQDDLVGWKKKVESTCRVPPCVGAAKIDVYTKNEVDTELQSKAEMSNVYTKGEVDSELESKAEKSNVYTKTEVDEKIPA